MLEAGQDAPFCGETAAYLPASRDGATATTLIDGRVLVAGGREGLFTV